MSHGALILTIKRDLQESLVVQQAAFYGFSLAFSIIVLRFHRKKDDLAHVQLLFVPRIHHMFGGFCSKNIGLFFLQAFF